MLINFHNKWPPVCDVLTHKSKVKGTLIQALRLCIGHTAHRGSRGIALPFHDHGTRRGWGVSVTRRPLFIPGKHAVPVVQEAGWSPGLVWTGAENLAPTRIRFPGRPARSQLLCQLRYLAHVLTHIHTKISTQIVSFLIEQFKLCLPYMRMLSSVYTVMVLNKCT